MNVTKSRASQQAAANIETVIGKVTKTYVTAATGNIDYADVLVDGQVAPIIHLSNVTNSKIWVGATVTVNYNKGSKTKSRIIGLGSTGAASTSASSFPDLPPDTGSVTGNIYSAVPWIIYGSYPAATNALIATNGRNISFYNMPAISSGGAIPNGSFIVELTVPRYLALPDPASSILPDGTYVELVSPNGLSSELWRLDTAHSRYVPIISPLEVEDGIIDIPQTRKLIFPPGSLYERYDGAAVVSFNGLAGSTFSSTAGETILAGAAVYVEMTNAVGVPGWIYNADSGNIGKSTGAALIGIAISNATSGNAVVVQWGGMVSGTFSGLTAGAPYYLSGSGSLTTVPGETLIGVAVTTSDFIINTRGSQGGLVRNEPFPTSNLVLWLDSSFGVSQSSGNVTAWTDQSPMSNDFNTVSSAYPIVSASQFGSLPGIYFDGNSSNPVWMQSINWSGWAAQNQVSVYAVIKWATQLSGSGNGAIIGNRGYGGSGVTTWDLYVNNTPSAFIWNGTTFTSEAISVSAGQATILSSIGNTSNFKVYQDGTLLGTTGYGMGSSTQQFLNLGISFGNPGPALSAEVFTGYVGAILIYDTVLSSIDDASVINYLKSRFGI